MHLNYRGPLIMTGMKKKNLVTTPTSLECRIWLVWFKGKPINQWSIKLCQMLSFCVRLVKLNSVPQSCSSGRTWSGRSARVFTRCSPTPSTSPTWTWGERSSQTLFSLGGPRSSGGSVTGCSARSRSLPPRMLKLGYVSRNPNQAGLFGLSLIPPPPPPPPDLSHEATKIYNIWHICRVNQYEHPDEMLILKMKVFFLLCKYMLILCIFSHL